MLRQSGKMKRHKRAHEKTDDNNDDDINSSQIWEKSSEKKKARRSSETSIFHELVTKAGLVLNTDSQSVTLTCDQAIFQKNLRKAILLSPRYGKETVVDKFIKTLDQYIEDPQNLKCILLPSQTAPDLSSCRGGQQDSLVRLLLNIDDIQPKLITLLTEKLLQVSYEEYKDEKEKLYLPRLILTNLTWLDHILNDAELTEKVVDMLQGSPPEVQKEVISFAPNIVNDAHQGQIAKVLCELYESTPELTAVILDSLSYLSLEPDVLEDIHHSVLKRLRSVDSQNLPVVVNFLLHNVTANSANQVLSDLREKILLPGERKKASTQSSQRRKTKNEAETNADLDVLLFSNIKMTLLIHKFLPIAWLAVINDVKDMDEIRSFDLLVLVLIYQVVPPRRRAIEGILKNMVRLGVSETLLSNSFTKHAAVLTEYFEAVKKLAGQLIRSVETGIAHFGTLLYKFCFVHLEPVYKQDVVHSLLGHLGLSQHVRSQSLSLLLTLAHEETAEMTKCIVILKNSLDVVHILSLREAKKLLETLLHLAYSAQGQSYFRDELSILTGKQLSHPNIKFRRLGVLSAVLTLKNSIGGDAETSTERSLDHEGDSEMSSLPDAAANEAKELFQSVRESTANCPQASALFMDELATNVLRTGLPRKMEKLISNKLIDDFEETFVVSCKEASSVQFPFSVSFQWNLDDSTDSEKAEAIAIAVASLAAKDNKGTDGSEGIILTLAPHIRLMRMVESHLNAGVLDNIDALLGCGVQMPDPSVYDNFASLSNSEQTLALTCLFYTVNWCRELVNAFVTQKDVEMRRKVILRLRKVVDLENLISKLLPLKPNFVPPPALFDFDSSSTPLNLTHVTQGTAPKKGKGKTSNGKGRKKSKKEPVDETTLTAPSQPPATGSSQKPSSSHPQAVDAIPMKNLRLLFRELHFDVFNLLFRNLCLDPELDKENPKYLFVAEAEFLLTDLNLKLAHVFESNRRHTIASFKTTVDKGAGFSYLDVFTAEEVSEQALRFVKPVCAHLETISEFFQSLIANNDGIEDAPNMFTSSTMPLLHLATSLFTSLRLLLAWPALHNADHLPALTSILKVIAKKLEGSSVDGMNTEELLSSTFRYLSNFSKSIIGFSTCVELANLLECLVMFTKDTEMKAKLGSFIEDEFLKKEWYTFGGEPEKGRKFEKDLLSLLKVFFRHQSNPVATIHRIASAGFKELSECTAKEYSSELYPTLKKSTLTTYYSVMIENLERGTNSQLSLPANSNSFKQLEVWNLAIKVFHTFVEPLKHFKTVYSYCLKYSSGFLSLFNRRGMPVMDKCLQRNQNEVIAILKNLQLSTRILQHLCNDAKSNQNVKLVGYVPRTKKNLETTLFRVKAMMAANDSLGAFWMGNLKNRDLQGEELLSQSREEEEEEEEGSEEEVESDLSDVDLNEEDSNDGKEGKKQESYSVSY